jgi:hypothetical protein
MIIEKHFFAYPSAGWLLGAMLCSTTFLDLPTIDQTTIVCFESHLICGLGLPPSKFLMCILNYIRCELIHLNSNTIDALSYISMQCECWLDIPPDTSLFWYFYYPARYERNVFSGIRLTLRSWDAGKCLLKMVSCQDTRCTPMAEQAPSFAACREQVERT